MCASGSGIRASSCASGCSAGRSASRMASSGGEWAPTTPGEGGPGLGMGRQRGEVYWRGAPPRNAGPRRAGRGGRACSTRGVARRVATREVGDSAWHAVGHAPREVGDDSLTTRAHQSRAWGQHHQFPGITAMKLGTAPLRARGPAARFAVPPGRPRPRSDGGAPDRRNREKADGGEIFGPQCGSNGSPHLWMGLWKFLTGA